MIVVLHPIVRQTAALAFLAMLAVVTYFALVFPGQLPDHQVVTGWNDFILHTGAFAALSVCAIGVRKANRRLIVMLAGIAVVLEAAQIFIPGRESDLWDLGANLFGVALGAFSMHAICILTPIAGRE